MQGGRWSNRKEDGGTRNGAGVTGREWCKGTVPVAVVTGMGWCNRERAGVHREVVGVM